MNSTVYGSTAETRHPVLPISPYSNNDEEASLLGNRRVSHISSSCLQPSVYAGCIVVTTLGIASLVIGITSFSLKWPIERSMTWSSIGTVLVMVGVWQGVNICLERKYKTFTRAVVSNSVTQMVTETKDDVIKGLESLKTALQSPNEPLRPPQVTDCLIGQAFLELATALDTLLKQNKTPSEERRLLMNCRQIPQDLHTIAGYLEEMTQMVAKKAPMSLPSLRLPERKLPETPDIGLEALNKEYVDLDTKIQYLKFLIGQIPDYSDVGSLAQKDATIKGVTDAKEAAVLSLNQNLAAEQTSNYELRKQKEADDQQYNELLALYQKAQTKAAQYEQCPPKQREPQDYDKLRAQVAELEEKNAGLEQLLEEQRAEISTK